MNKVTEPRKRSLNDVRAPIMMLAIAAFCGGRLGSVPVWTILAGMSPVMVGLAFFYERILITELFKWSWKWAFVSVGACAGMYVMMHQSLQLASDLAVGAAMGEIETARLPAVFEMLLHLKKHAAQTTPMVVGLVGAFVLAPSEEIFWRGFILTRLMPLVGHWPAVLVTTVFYGGFYWILLGSLASAAAVFTGLVYGAMTIKSRSLMPAIIAHVLLWAMAMGVISIL